MQTLLSHARAMARLRYWLIAGLLIGIPTAALAHERFISHTPKMKIYEPFFDFLGGNMLSIAARVAVMMGMMMFVWFIREPLDHFIHNVIAKSFPEPIKGILRFGTDFAFDKPVDAPWFKTLHSWCVIFFMRCPALVLMFAAANKSLVMPSYPLEPSTVFFFQFAQVVMAIGILTQSFLPFGGATIFGTFIYLLIAFDWKIAVDVLPVLTVAVIYVSSPWDSWKRVIMMVTKPQMKWVQFILGLGFFLLGWMKLYNYYLTVGVADNYPEVLKDPMVLMFYAGTSPHLTRECWIMAFGMAEVMTGFLVMIGMFSRVWCFMMVYLFSKLMIVNFGWAEIPHLYPIGAFLLVMFSNNLTNEFTKIDDRAAKASKTLKDFIPHAVLSGILGFSLAALAVYPALYLLPFSHPKAMPTLQRSAEWHPNADGTGGDLKIWIGPVPKVAGENLSLSGTLSAKLHRVTTDKAVQIDSSQLQKVTLATSDQPTILTIPIKNANAVDAITLQLLRSEDKEAKNPLNIGISVEPTRGFTRPAVNSTDIVWNTKGASGGVLTAFVQPLPQIGGEETKLNCEATAKVIHPDGTSVTRTLKPVEIFSSNAPTTLTFQVDGAFEADDIKVDARFTKDTDPEQIKHLILLDIQHPKEAKDKKTGEKMKM